MKGLIGLGWLFFEGGPAPLKPELGNTKLPFPYKNPALILNTPTWSQLCSNLSQNHCFQGAFKYIQFFWGGSITGYVQM